jgi:REP element-mobilizing transposase RayT
MKGFDYSQEGLYYITICVENKQCLLGKIAPGLEMILNEAGKIVNECWLKIPEHFPNVILHEYVIMPNHIHGIIELTKSGITYVGVENFQPLHLQNDTTVGVQNFEPLLASEQYHNKSKHNEFQKIIPHSVGSIVRGFKTGVTKWFRNNTDIENIWQRNYYEIVIRNSQAYLQIADYIINNPKKWENDDYFNTDS